MSIYYFNFWKVNSKGEDLSEDLKRPDLPFIIVINGRAPRNVHVAIAEGVLAARIIGAAA